MQDLTLRALFRVSLRALFRVSLRDAATDPIWWRQCALLSGLR